MAIRLKLILCTILNCFPVLLMADELQAWVDTFSPSNAIGSPGMVETQGHGSEFQPYSEETKSRTNRENTRKQMLAEVERAWRRPEHRSQLHEIAGRVGIERDISRLKKIRIPRAEFTNLPVSIVVDQLAAVSERYDEEGKGINIVVVDPSGLDPKISMTLRDLSLDRILDLIVESIGFEYHAQTDVVVLRASEESGYGLETEFFPLNRSTLIRLTGVRSESVPDPTAPDPFAPVAGDNHLNEQEELESGLLRFFQRAGVPFTSVAGASLAFADGQLIVTHTPRNLDRVRNILRRYSQIRQVEIETRFIEVEAERLAEIGMEWQMLTSGKPMFDSRGLPVITESGSQLRSYRNRITNSPTRRITGGTNQSANGNNRIIIDRPGTTIPDLGYGPPSIPSRTGMNVPGGDLANISGVIGSSEFNLLIRALERESGSDLLSAPKVTVLSGKTAEITVAQEFRYPQNFGDISADVGRGDSTSGSAGVAITAGTPRDFAVRNLGVEMRVTPSVEEDNAISLRLEPAVTEFDGFIEYGGPSVAIASDTTVTVPSGFYQPLFSVRRIRTEVTIWDGATVVMGGLTREESVHVEDRVPVLGGIPVLGRLFRSEGVRSQKRNLLIFVTANLVSPGGSHSRLQDIDPGPSSKMDEGNFPKTP